MTRPVAVALLLCDAASVDAAGKVTLSGLVDVLWAPRFPAVHPELTVFWKCRFASDGDAWLAIEAPDGRTVVTTQPIRAAAGDVAQEINRLVDLELVGPGTYWVQLLSTNGPLAETPLEVRARV